MAEQQLDRKFVEKYLRQHIDSYYLGNRRNKIKKSELDYPSHYAVTWRDMIEIFEIWQNQGWVKIVKSPIDAADNDICLEIISYSTGTEVPQGWIKD